MIYAICGRGIIPFAFRIVILSGSAFRYACFLHCEDFCRIKEGAVLEKDKNLQCKFFNPDLV